MNNMETSKESRFLYGLLTILIAGILIPVGCHFIIHAVWIESVWNQIPLHSTMEAVGAISLIILAALLQSLQKENESSHYVWIASGLMGMGLLNAFHAAVFPGNQFVWLYCIAAFLGGFFFFLVWLPDEVARKPFAMSLPFITLITAAVIGIVSVTSPDSLPLMIFEGRFTLFAKWMNVIAGILFSLTAVYFLLRFQRGLLIEDVILAVLCALFGSAAVMFPLSTAWSPDWWLWHLMRMSACLLSVIYVFSAFRKINSLTLRIAEREQARTVLEGVLTQVSETVNVLSSASTEILTSTTQIAAAALETATAITQTTSTVEEVRQTAQLANQKALNVQESSRNVTESVQKGSNSVMETIEGMEHIRQQMLTIADIVMNLSEQSQTIGEITSTVNDIADQSNLLAVNAAIEAVKAGEQGLGFSVVAQEIRNLSEQSKQATLQIRTILNAVQKGVNKAVLATEQGTKAVDTGSIQAKQSGEAIMLLSESINEAMKATVQIAASSQQQLAGMDQIAPAMESIQQAMALNASGAGQTQNAAQNLHDLGQRLKVLVEKFQV